MTPIQELIHLKWQQSCSTTSMPPAYVPKPTYKIKTANGLTKACIDWINLNGGLAERITSMGRAIDQTKMVSDVLGRRYKVGSIKYIPGTSRNGTADISATFKNSKGEVVSWKIEIKIAADRQSDAQKQYQADIERAGGVYSLIKTYDQFYSEWKQLT